LGIIGELLERRMMGNYNRRGVEGMRKLSQHRTQKMVVVYYLIKNRGNNCIQLISPGDIIEGLLWFENPSTTSLAQGTRDASGKNRP
jgi:hypothetical protein